MERNDRPVRSGAAGFTLIELLTVVAIISILAAIGVPQLLRARLAANESSSIAALRAISSSEANYATTCGHGGYATDLADLVRPSPASGIGFLSPDLAVNGVRKSGYIYNVAKNADPGTFDIVQPSCNGATSTRASSFFASAVPISPGGTGNRHFATDTPGTIYVAAGGAVPNPIPAGASALQ
jgi:prepilin-type N-terminal cleavage/methylation domain-containing protein